MRQPEAKLYAFIQNTDKKISDDAIGALKEYEIKPALWSKKDSYISELIAWFQSSSAVKGGGAYFRYEPS